MLAFAAGQNRRRCAGRSNRLVSRNMAEGEAAEEKNNAAAEFEANASQLWRRDQFLAGWADDSGATKSALDLDFLSAVATTETPCLATRSWSRGNGVCAQATRVFSPKRARRLALVGYGRVHFASVFFFDPKNQGQNSRQNGLRYGYLIERELLVRLDKFEFPFEAERDRARISRRQ
jgi:hypothetical protein